jgi:hypothetical protein
VSVEQDCAANGVFGRPSPTLLAWATQVRPVHLPADAVLVLATRCLYEVHDVPGDGSWAFLIEQRADSGLDALAAALRLPDWDPRTCTILPAYPMHIITVTDTRGRVLHVVLPTDPCRLRKAVDVVNAMSWQTTGTVKVQQTRSQLEVSTGCLGSYKPFVDLRGGEPFTTDPTATSLTVCVYTPDPIVHIGKFTKASTVEGSAAAAILSAIAAAPAVTDTCTDEAPFATINEPGGLVIELGGCYRAQVGYSVRQLDAATVQGWHLS